MQFIAQFSFHRVRRSFHTHRAATAAGPMPAETVLSVVKLVVTAGFSLLIAVILIFKWKEKQRRPPRYGGYVHPQFEHLKEIFLDNLSRNWERDGAAVCIYYKNECVVDLWGGFADRDSQREWRRDTMQIIFSSSKALGAICIAILVDRGLVGYDMKISSFWPEFGKKGKENITVQMVLNHTAGLALLDKDITWNDATDPSCMASLLEEQRPSWPPGSAIGYHAFSYGWLVDQIIRKIDRRGRGSGDFWREEVAEKHGLDLFIGLPRELCWRVARITRPSIWDRIDEFLTDPENVDYLFVIKQYIFRGMSKKVATNPSWMQSIFRVTLNNPDVYVLEQPAVLGIGTARDMARLASLLVQGKILSQDTLALLNEPLLRGVDVVSGATTTRGRGITVVDYNRNGIFSRMVGHAGLGGQNLRWDTDNNICIAYLSNGLKGGLGDRARSYVRIMDALYDCLPGNNNRLSKTKQ